MAVERFDVVTIGAGFCGLATGASLRANGVERFAILEQGDGVGHFWSKTYDRIHLHSPYHGLPADGGAVRRYPEFKSRDDLIAYFREYAALHGLAPKLQFGRRVTSVSRLEQVGTGGMEWRIETDSGASYEARYVVVATASNRVPHLPDIPGREAYRGRLLHSAEYRRAEPYRGLDVLVIGSGNSAAEISLDLSEHGARSVSMWVRGPRHFIPVSRMKWLFRIATWTGILSEERLLQGHKLVYGTPEFEAAVQGRDSLPSRFSVDLSRFGIRKPARGPNMEVYATGRIPVFDVGAIRAIRKGTIRIIDGNARPIERFTEKGVRFRDGERPFDAVVLATGFEPRLEEFVAPELLGVGRWGKLLPITDRRSRSTVHPSAFFPGFDVSVNGGHSLGLWGWECGEKIAAELRS
jgi:indole-3-pyruvate monooxygenase